MAAKIVPCRKGDPCNFTITFPAGVLTAGHTQATFQARESWDEAAAEVIKATQADGISFDYGANQVTVQLSVAKTEAMAVVGKPREVPALLRIYDPLDADATFSVAIPFLIRPETIDD